MRFGRINGVQEVINMLSSIFPTTPEINPGMRVLVSKQWCLAKIPEASIHIPIAFPGVP
jgi:hypothetical protein